jgi:aryl-alcohol dehydrogenase-like predicted oxidoreductase
MLQDDGWDSVMLGFHMLHQNARELVFPETMRQGIGTLLMFVVRNIFSQPEYLRNTISELIAQGTLADDAVDVHDPLGFLVHEGGASSVTDAAYRFVRHEPGVHVVLFGTGKLAHVESNIASILKPPLPAQDQARLSALFGHLVGIGLDLPDRIPGP